MSGSYAKYRKFPDLLHFYLFILNHILIIYMFVFKSWTAIVSRTFTVKRGLSRKEIIQLKVSLLKVFVGTLSDLLSVAGHRVSVEVLRAIQILIAPSPDCC